MAAIIYRSKLRRFSDLVNELEKGTPFRSWFQTILEEANHSSGIDLRYVIDDLTYALLKCRVFVFQRDSANRKVCYFLPFLPELVFKISMHRQIKNINDKLNNSSFQVTFRQKVYGSLDSSWPAHPSNIIGFDDTQRSLSRIIKHGSQTAPDRFISIAIVGTGGSGKTTLAQKLLNSFGNEDFEIKIWVSMSRYLYSNEDYKPILLSMFQQLMKNSVDCPPFIAELSEMRLMDILREKLRNRSYLVVLDGVHHVNDWLEKLSCNLVEGDEIINNLSYGLPKGSGNSAVIVTTRDEEAAEKIVGKNNIYRMKRLKDDECWRIFQNSFGEDGYQDTLDRMKDDICNDCKGLPLVAKALGTIVRRSELATPRWD